MNQFLRNHRQSLLSQHKKRSLSSLIFKGKERNNNSNDERVTKTKIKHRTKENRKIVNSYLSSLGNGIQIGSKGICYFQFKKFVIVIEVPEDEEQEKSISKEPFFYIYTMVLRLESNNDDDRFSILKACMELNYMKQGTRGSTLGLEGNEINLCYSHPIASITGHEGFMEVLTNFIVTALDANKRLDLLINQPKINMNDMDEKYDEVEPNSLKSRKYIVVWDNNNE